MKGSRMFPSHFPVPIIVQMLLIGTCVILCLVLLQQPLALLGLMMLPSIPVMEDGDSPDEEGSGRPIGFTADID